MKNIFIATTLSLLFLPVLCSAEEAAPPDAPAARPAAPPATKLEAFLGKRGFLVVRDFQDAGKVERSHKSQYSTDMLSDYWVNVTALTVYEPGKENVRLKGLQLSLADFRNITKYGTGLRSGLSFVDLEEADSLSKALQYLLDLEGKWKGQDVGGKEAYFTTKDDFKVLLAQTADKPASYYLTIDGNSLSFTSEEIAALKAAVDKGMGLLKTP
jgi:hypothetical protein